MEKQSRGKRASEHQKEYLVDFLETNVDIANDKFVTADGAKFRNEKWRELSVELNALGGTKKDGSKWKKYWSDLRVHTKAKYSNIKQKEQRSGVNGLRKATTLSPLEEKIIQIITVEAVDGDNTREVGFDESTLDIEDDTHAASVDIIFDEGASFACDTTETAPYLEQAKTTKNLSTTTATATTSNATAQASATSGSFSTAATSGAFTRAANSGMTTAAAKRVKRSQKKRTQESTDHVLNLFNIEEKKLKAMEAANNLKREELQLMREKMADVKTDIELKRDLCCKLQEVIEVFKVYN